MFVLLIFRANKETENMNKKTKNPMLGPKTTGNRWADDRIGAALNRPDQRVIDTALRVMAKLENGTLPPKLVWQRCACDNMLGFFGKGGK